MSDEESKLESAISWILLVGVVASVVLDSAGLALGYLNTHDLALPLSSTWHVQATNFFSFVESAVPSVSAGPSAVSLLTLGIILLILTPYLRVVASVIFYAARRDFRYLGITLLVLVIITISLVVL